MNKSLFKPIAFGVLFGALAFFLPFFLMKVFFFFLIAGLFFRMFGRKRHGGPGWGGYQMAFADKIRGMNDTEYEAFKQQFQGRCHYRNQPEGSSQQTATNA